MKLENKKSSCPRTSLFILFFFHLHTWNYQKLECLFKTEAFNYMSNNLINSLFIKSVTGRRWCQNCLIPKLEFYIRCDPASGCFVLHTHKRRGCDVWPFYSSSDPWGGGVEGFSIQTRPSDCWCPPSNVRQGWMVTPSNTPHCHKQCRERPLHNLLIYRLLWWRGGSRVLWVCSLDLIYLGKCRKAHIKSNVTLHSEGQL